MRRDQVEASLAIMKFIVFSSCLQFFVICGASWMNRHVLPELLNHQVQLDLMLLETTGASSTRYGSKFRGQLERSLVLTLALIMALAPAVILSRNAHAFLDLFFSSFVMAYLWFSAVLHEYVIVLSFRKLRQQFERVRDSMHIWSNRKCNTVKNDTLHSWCETLLSIRHQGELLSRYLAPTELPTLLLAMILSTLCLFYALNVMQGRGGYEEENSEKLYALYGCLGCAVVSLVILYCNVNLAQKIPNKVQYLTFSMDV